MTSELKKLLRMKFGLAFPHFKENRIQKQSNNGDSGVILSS